MAQFLLPTLGETATSGVVAKVLVSAGEKVEPDQPVLELETDKAVLEVPSTVSGTIGELLIKQGDTVSVDQPVFSYSEGGDSGNGAAPKAESNGSAPASAAASDSEPEQTAASAQKIGSSNGSPSEEKAPAASAVKNDGMTDTSAPTTPSQPQSFVQATSEREPVPAAPSTRRIARELGVDIHAVTGSGIGGRISEDDVRAFADGGSKGAGTAPGVSAGAGAGIAMPPLPDFSKLGETERVPMSGIRRATSDQMMRAWTIPHVTQFDKADSTAFEKFRKGYGPLAEKRGAKLTPTAILLKICVAALKKFPNFNASIDFSTNEVVQKKFYNIGVAVDTPNGLVVPVIRNVESKGIIELAVELGEIAAKARDRKLKPEDMSGGTFTLSNLGGIGGTHFTPIVNTPEVAILGVARGSIEPVWNKETEQFEPRMMMPLCLSYDHRVIDGADGARFTRALAAMIEDPNLIALEG